MMNFNESLDAFECIEGWEVVTWFAVGRFEWLGFSVKSPNKMICISTQRTTIVDCDTGNVKDCAIEWDEQKCIAVCNELPDETISIVGQYAGRLQTTSGKGEKICREDTDKNIEKICFSTPKQEVVVDWSYRPYVSGFSGNGNYFVHATDAGVVILRRKPGKIDIEARRLEDEVLELQPLPANDTRLNEERVIFTEVKQKAENEITIEEFARLRKRSFHNGIAALTVLAVAFVLLFVMMGSNVDEGNVYKYRTFTFVIGLMQICVIGLSSQKVFKLQKEHPEWLAETSALNNKVTEPKEWKIRRLGAMFAVLVTIIISFITWYEPGTKNVYDGNTYQYTSDPANSIDYQNVVDAIDELEINNK